MAALAEFPSVRSCLLYLLIRYSRLRFLPANLLAAQRESPTSGIERALEAVLRRL